MKKKFNLPLGRLAVAGLAIGTCCATFMGETVRPYDMVGVKFCPKTANIRKSNYKHSQQQLDKQYCQYEHKMLAEVWERKQYSALKPLPEDSFIIRDIPATKATHWWYLLSIASVGGGVLAWAKKCEKIELAAHYKLEGYKTQIKIFGVNSREERDFKTDTVRNQWVGMRLETGLISQEGINERFKKQSEVQDATHSAALKQFDAGNSEMDKTIAENLRDAAKADKERAKLQGKGSNSDADSTTQNVDELRMAELTSALKAHEDGWLWYLVESFTPIIIYGKAGSYKSYSAACIALLKHYLIDAKIHSIADVDFNQNRNDSWKYLVPLEPAIYGSGIDWEDYGNAYLDAIERSKTRTLNDSPIVSIWDELTNALGKFDNAPNIIPFVIATPRKRNEHCILISHGLTQNNLGGCESISEPIKTQTYRLNLKTNPTGKPLFKGTLNGLVDEDGEDLEDKKITLPSWFRPETIHGHFNGKPIKFDNF